MILHYLRMITESCNEGSMQNPFGQRAIGSWTVSSIGLGCMNLSHAYGLPPPPAAAAQVQGAREVHSQRDLGHRSGI